MASIFDQTPSQTPALTAGSGNASVNYPTNTIPTVGATPASGDIETWLQQQKTRLDTQDLNSKLASTTSKRQASLGISPDGGTSKSTDPKETSETPSSVSLPTQGESGCVQFPVIQIPSFSLPSISLPSITLPSLPSCQDGDFTSDYPSQTQKTAKDVTLPKATPATGTGKTIVSTPSNPQAISTEIAKVAPNVASELATDFSNALLIGARTTGAMVNSMLAMLTDKADALADDGLQLLAKATQAVVNTAGSVEDFAADMVNGGGNAINQVAAAIPVVPITVGFHNPSGAIPPQLGLASDAMTQASRMTDGTTKSPQDFLSNGVKLTKDLHNVAAGQDLASKACFSFSKAATAVSQGLAKLALCAHMDGILWSFSLHLFHIDFGGMVRLPHTWKFDCHQLVNGLEQSFTTLSSATTEIANTVAGGVTGAMPGNLLYAAMGTAPGNLTADNLALELPLLIAAVLGSPFISLIESYLTNPDPQYDGLTSQLPTLYAAGNPALAKLLTELEAFATLIKQLNALTTDQMTSLQNGVTQIGGATLTFIQDVRSKSPSLGSINTLAKDLLANRLSQAQHDALLSLATEWDNLATSLNLSAISDLTLRYLVEPIITSRQGVFGPNDRMDNQLNTTVDDRNTFGGPVGMELVYIVAIFAALVRILLLLHQNYDIITFGNRSQAIASDAQQHGDQVTYGAPYVSYISTLANNLVGGGGGGPNLSNVVTALMPSAIQAVQAMTNNQHTQASLVHELTAQQRGGNSHSVSEPANQIDLVRETSDTQAYIAGALDRHNGAMKEAVTTTIADLGASTKAASDAGLSDQLTARSSDVQTVVQETSNALASTTLLKATGAKLNQQYEGAVNQTKFSLNQAGTSYAIEAPFIRQAGRVLLSQGRIVVTEGDSVDTRAQWSHTHAGDWGVMAQHNSFINANESLVLSGNTTNIYGQSGTTIADKGKVRINSGSESQLTLDGGTAGLQGLNVSVNAKGDLVLSATTTVIIQVGGMAISISAGGISLAPPGIAGATSPGVDTISPINAAVPAIQTQDDLKAVALPARGDRNPIPCVAPYKR